MSDQKEDLKAILKELHLAVGDDLLAKVKSGTASPATLMAAIRFLKENGVSCEPSDLMELDKAMKEGRQLSALPFPSDNEDVGYG